MQTPFEVPSVKGDTIQITRDHKKILRLLEDTINYDLNEQSLVTGITITENYLFDTLLQIINWYPQKLLVGDMKFDVSMVIESYDLDELISRIVEKRIYSVFYDSPVKYLNHIEQTLNISIPEEIKKSYAEIKATRDLIVHNDGVINELYIRKTGKEARSKIGDKIWVSAEYFDGSITCMKKLVALIFEQILEKYGDAK